MPRLLVPLNPAAGVIVAVHAGAAPPNTIPATGCNVVSDDEAVSDAPLQFKVLSTSLIAKFTTTDPSSFTD